MPYLFKLLLSFKKRINATITTNEELTKDVQGMDINELKRKKRLLETKIDTLIATFIDENKGIHIHDVDVKISEVRNQMAKEEVASFVETTITLTL